MGDRAIILFADILRANLSSEYFIGHIGGDDFFVGIRTDKKDFEKHYNKIELISYSFRKSVKSLYSKEDREKGYIEAKSRENKQLIYPLLSVASAVINISGSKKNINTDDLSHIFSKVKKCAKESIGDICSCSVY